MTHTMIENLDDADGNSPGAFLKSVLESAMNGILSFQAIRSPNNEIVDFELRFANREASGVLKVDLTEGEKLQDLIPGIAEDGIFNQFIHVVESGESISAEYIHHIKDNTETKWLRISAVKLGDGLTITVQDISDLKETVIEMEAREKKYQKIFEESMDAIFVIDSDYRFVDGNSALKHMFGYNSGELLHMKLEDFFEVKDDFEIFQKTLLDQGRVEEFEVDLSTINGEKKICLINCVSIHSQENGHLIHLGVIRDMTKRKQADRQLLLAEKLSMTGKIARTIAHEVRNPLTNLTLALEQLRDEVPDDVEDTDLYFGMIQRNADRIGKLISDLLNSSKPKTLNFKMQSINTMVMGALELVKDRLKLQNMALKTDFDEDLPPLALDAEQLEVALLNLFVNATEAMKEDQGILSVKTYRHKEDIVLQVSDNGKGMTEEEADKLFEPFYTSKKEGTGLGLTTVQNIIHGHGGQIYVSSTLGQGTTFDIHFEDR